MPCPERYPCQAKKPPQIGQTPPRHRAIYDQTTICVHERDQPALLVPQDEAGSIRLGKSVYVVGADSKAEQKLVTLGPTDSDLVSVTGVAATDRVIAGNLQKLGPGPLVKPHGAVRPLRS
jgi:hypothetical protein